MNDTIKLIRKASKIEVISYWCDTASAPTNEGYSINVLSRRGFTVRLSFENGMKDESVSRDDSMDSDYNDVLFELYERMKEISK